jgi:hypothetical protein
MSAVLMPLDGSGFAEQALPLALDIARRTGAGLDLVLAPTRKMPLSSRCNLGENIYM